MGGSSSAPVVPVLPESDSGVRSSFLLAMGQVLGLGPGASLTPGSCVVDGSDSAGAIQEDTGVTPGDRAVFGTTTDPMVDAIVPYAISAYIAQTGHQHSGKFWKPAELGIHRVTDSNGVAAAAIKSAPGGGSAGEREEINPSFPAQLWRTIYDVVPNAGTAAAPAVPTAPINLQTLFGNGANTRSWFCHGNGTGPGALLAYGFTLIGGVNNTGCGVVTDEFLTYGS